MLNILAALPMCYIVVATDAPNVQAVVWHEGFHCYGWTHSHRSDNRAMNSTYRAEDPPWHYRRKGPYPLDRMEIYYDTSANVQKICGSAYGCKTGGGVK